MMRCLSPLADKTRLAASSFSPSRCTQQSPSTSAKRTHHLPTTSTIIIRQSSTTSTNNHNIYTPSQRKSDHKHCVELVQTRDTEGYLCGLLMPSSSREAYFALRAFNVEIASIKDASKLIGGRSRSSSSSGGGGGMFDVENELGEGQGGDATLPSRLRMQWWRDAIADVYDHNNKSRSDASTSSSSSSSQDPILQSLTSSRKFNPTLRSLTHAIQSHNLTHRFLRRIMEAREQDLSITQYEQRRDVAQYGEDTVSNMLYLSLETVGVRDEESDRVASDIGVGVGVLTALRSTAFRASQGECSIPLDLASKYNVSMDTLYQAYASMNNTDERDLEEELGDGVGARESLRGATIEMAEMASFHLQRARENQGKVPKDGRMCLLPAVCALKYLDSLKECDYDVLHPRLVGGGDDAAAVERRRRLSLMLMLGRTWLTGTF